MNNEFELQLTALLNQAKSKKQINADIKALQTAVNSLKLVATFSKAESKKELNAYIKQLSTQLSTLKLKAKIDNKNLKTEINNTLKNASFKDIDLVNIDENKTKLKVRKVLADMKSYTEKTPISVNIQFKKEKLSNDLTSFLNKNTKIRESSFLLAESERIRELIDSVDDNDQKALRNATDAFSLFRSEVTATGYAGKSTAQKIKDMLSHVTKIGSFFGVASLAINNFKKSLGTLKNNDTILTEISKTSEMTKKQLEELGNEAFKVASKYGQLSSNYLLGVQEMSRAGYENADSMAELSTKVQGAGDMTAELANQYLIATDKAYKLNGSIGALTTTLDGANNITNHNAVNMTELAEGMSVVGTQAASSQMEVNEITAAIGTMVATTQKSGREMGNAFKGILMNLQQVSGDVGDGEDIIDAESLTKYEKACAELGVSLKEVRNGVVSLKEPMQILKELSEAYTQLDESDAKRANLLSAVGGKYRANALNAILENYDLYEKMLQDYADGLGSMEREAEKTAKSWEGRLNSLQNSFDSFVNTITNKDAVMGGISFFDRLIQGAEELTNAIGEIPVVLTALNSVMVATNKDYGITQIWNKDKGKIDIQGNIFGIDITNIKNLKKHFAEASEVMTIWNNKLVSGKANIETFNYAVVQNNAQFKAYLSTCSKDAPASLEGYKSYLKAAGTNTDALRLKTILLNSAITMLGGWAIQAVITGFYELSQVSSKVRESAEELGSTFKSTKSDIESYKTRIEELYNTINDSNSSIEDVTEARKNLMTIQDELIEKFGDEKEVIDIITQAINGQADAIDRLAEKQWQETKNQFNDTGFWEGIGNWFDGYDSNIERMVDKMEHAREILSFSANDLDSNKFDDLVHQMEKLGWTYQGTLGGFVKEGNLKGIYSDILEIQNLVKDLDAPDKFLKDLTHDANSTKETLDDYGEMWDTYILRDVIFENEDLAQSWNDVNEAYSEYRKAFESGDKEAQNSAIDGFSQSLNNVLDNSDVAESVKEYFRNMYPTLTNEMEKWEFRYKILPDLDIHALKGKTQADILEMLQVDGSQYGEDTFNSLLRMASDYGIVIGDDSKKIEQLLDLLVEWEVLQGEVQNSPSNNLLVSFDLSTYKDQIDNFQSNLKTLGDALTSIRSGSFENSDLADLLQEFPELADKSDDLESALVELINNSLKVLYDTLGEEVPDGLKVSLQELADIASGTAMHLSDAFSSIHDSWDILQDFKDTMEAGFDDNITDSLLQSVRGLSGELETLVAGYYSGIVTAEELYKALTEHYENDLHNYSEALIKKNDLNTDFYNAVGMASEEVVNQFMDDYDIDLENCKTYNQAKLEIEKQTLGQISALWSQYYDAQSKTLKISMSEIEARAAHGGGDAAAFLEQYKLIENYEAAMEALNNITYDGIRSNFESISSKLNVNSNSSSKSSSTETTKEFSEELNWVEKLVNKVSTALDKLKDKVSNTYIGWSIRNHSLSKAMEKTNDAIVVQQQAYEKYMQKAASVGLSQEYINKIQDGTLDIETITDEVLSEQIENYTTWYEKALDCSDAIEELKTQLADLAKQRFDNINAYFEGLIETTEKSISKLETKEKNTFKAPSAKVYNDLYAETENLINYNTQRVQQLEEALDSAVNSGYIEAGSEAWREMYNEILDVRNATEEYRIELQEISKRSYEAILKPIEQELAQLEQRKSIIDTMQDRLALQGYVAAKGLYERLLRDDESRLETLKEQAVQLQQNMQDALSKGLEVGSDDWIDMKSAIDENVISVMELENSMIELNNAIRELEWDKFDRLQKSISRITGESDFMIDMFDKEDIYDEDGKLTDAGSAVIGLHAQNYFAYKEQSKAYKDEVDKINKELEADPTNTTLIDRKNDLIDAYQNATKAAYDEYEAVIELAQDGYQAQIDSIQELIDAKKKQLEADKSLYEYQKSVAEKTKNITDIQKQLSALANDDSEENKAKIQQLKVDLTDAQKDLEDAQYDKWYNDQQDMLDRLAEEYAALILEQSQNEQELFQEMIEYVNANAQGIQDTISSTAEEWGYVFNYGIDSVLEPGLSGITDIGQNIYEEIQRLYELNERMYRVSADLADLGVTDYGLETTISDETTARNFIERLYNGLLGRQADEGGLNYWMDKLMNGETVQDMLEGFLNSDEYQAMGKSAADTILDFYEGLLGRTAEQAGYQYWIDQYNNGMSLSEIGTHGFLDSNEFLSRDFWMGLLDAKPAISNVSEKMKMPELVPIDMSEYIAELRTRGAGVGEVSELNSIPQDLRTIFSSKNAPQINLPNFTATPNVTNMGNSIGDVHNTITIPIEHVADYNDFVTQLQKDGKFEKMIQDMTIGQLVGKSSLAKNSYKWT